MDNGAVRQSYEILDKIYRENTFTNLLMKDVASPRVAKIVYGVLEKHYSLNYIIDELAVKGVKNNVRPLLLIAGYEVIYLKTPLNVALNEINDTAKSMGKDAVVPFVDALIRKMALGQYKEPSKSDSRYCEYTYNLPSWLVGMYKKDYPDTYKEIIEAYDRPPRTHVVPNKGVDEDAVKKADVGAKKTLTGYYVKNNKEIAMLNFMGEITYMSYPSSLIPYSLKVKRGDSVLDCCAAPGGKGVFLANCGAKVTMCDVYDHRVKLIESYCRRMGVKADVRNFDATVFNPEWEEKFDFVLADAPCSGFGVTGKKKDIVFNKSYEDILSLAALQEKILFNVCRYVKKGGILAYSTCTLFSKENGDNIKKFLAEHADFSKEKIDLPYENDGEIQFLPDGKGMEGFYLCRMKRN